MTQETGEVAVRSQRCPLGHIAAVHTINAESDHMLESAHLAVVAVNILVNLNVP